MDIETEADVFKRRNEYAKSERARVPFTAKWKRESSKENKHNSLKFAAAQEAAAL
jgi:hypothetical protein